MTKLTSDDIKIGENYVIYSYNDPTIIISHIRPYNNFELEFLKKHIDCIKRPKDENYKINYLIGEDIKELDDIFGIGLFPNECVEKKELNNEEINGGMAPMNPIFSGFNFEGNNLFQQINNDYYLNGLLVKDTISAKEGYHNYPKDKSELKILPSITNYEIDDTKIQPLSIPKNSSLPPPEFYVPCYINNDLLNNNKSILQQIIRNNNPTPQHPQILTNYLICLYNNWRFCLSYHSKKTLQNGTEVPPKIHIHIENYNDNVYNNFKLNNCLIKITFSICNVYYQHLINSNIPIDINIKIQDLINQQIKDRILIKNNIRDIFLEIIDNTSPKIKEFMIPSPLQRYFNNRDRIRIMTQLYNNLNVNTQNNLIDPPEIRHIDRYSDYSFKFNFIQNILNSYLHINFQIKNNKTNNIYNLYPLIIFGNTPIIPTKKADYITFLPPSIQPHNIPMPPITIQQLILNKYINTDLYFNWENKLISEKDKKLENCNNELILCKRRKNEYKEQFLKCDSELNSLKSLKEKEKEIKQPLTKKGKLDDQNIEEKTGGKIKEKDEDYYEKYIEYKMKYLNLKNKK